MGNESDTKMSFTQNYDCHIPQAINEKIVGDALSKVPAAKQEVIDSINTNILGATIGRTHTCYVTITFSNDSNPIQEKYQEQW